MAGQACAAMKIQFVSETVPVSPLEQRIIASVLLAHFKTLILSFLQRGVFSSAEDAEEAAVEGVRLYATEAFPELKLKLLPDVIRRPD
jgi:hypothetical protein